MVTNPKPKKETMPIIRFIGDVHGKFGRYSQILKDSPHKTIQVGDMGVGFRKYPHGTWSANPPYDLMVEKGARFERGNHDNPDVCSRHTQYIADGTIEGNMMFCGGAVSIDKPYRVEGYSWWPDEELSNEQLEPIIDAYIAAKPEIMVTHECTESVAERIAASLSMRGHPIKLEEKWKSRHRAAFQRMFEAHKPKLWVHGHWHVAREAVIDGTRFICLEELGTIDIDTDRCCPVGDDGQTYS
jgi:hypothetical protein